MERRLRSLHIVVEQYEEQVFFLRLIMWGSTAVHVQLAS